MSALARQVGIKDSTLRKWVDGPSEPNRSKLVQIANQAGVSLARLAGVRGENAGCCARYCSGRKNNCASAPRQVAIDTPAPRRPWGLIPLDRPLPVILRVLDVLEREGVRIPRNALPDILTLVLALPDDPDNPCLLARLTHLVEE